MDQKWKSLASLVDKRILKTVKTMGFRNMTPVQSSTIPTFLQKKDVAVEAITGSGKTLAFVIPMVQMLLQREDPWKKNEIGAIVISPTRELALQTDEVVSRFLSRIPSLSKCVLVGGSNATSDEENLSSGMNIIIATPGRLEDAFKRKFDSFDMKTAAKSLEVLILDEADRLLDLGFEISINTILGLLPKQRRTGLFSATQTDELVNLMRAGLRNPVKVTVREKGCSEGLNAKMPARLNNLYMVCSASEKINQLIAFLRQSEGKKHLIFMSTCACVDYFGGLVREELPEHKVLLLHRKLRQKRHVVFEEFRSLERGLLLCTDVMARGIDIPDIDWVIQFDPPSMASTFVHRCGRTARMGHGGDALLFLMDNEAPYIDFLRINQQVELHPVEKNPSPPDCLSKLKQMALADRAVFEKGLQAFVSYVQSYAKHECSLILRVKDLALGQLAVGFALLKLPKMPELQKRGAEGFVETVVDMNEIAFKEKAREKQRQQKLSEFRATGVFPGKRRLKFEVGVEACPLRAVLQNASWSKQREKKTRRERRQKRPASEPLDEDELSELAHDVSLMKKLKKGKISQHQFDQEFCHDQREDAEPSPAAPVPP